jgi:prepilin-type N-terminal cleavage/methylation domain-containing protein
MELTYTKEYIQKRGFTLLEILIVITLVIFLSGVSASFEIESYRKTLAHFDVQKVVSILRRARSLAQHTVCENTSCTHAQEYSIMVSPHSLTLYEGSFITSESETFPLDGIEVASSTGIITFEPHSAEVLLPKSIFIPTSISNIGSTSVWEISVNTQGAFSVYRHEK